MRTLPRPASGFLVVGILVTLLLGCSDDSDRRRSGRAIDIISPPPDSMVRSGYVTIEAWADSFTRATAMVGELAIPGVKSGDRLFFFDVPLVPGANEILLTATKPDGETVDTSLTITSTSEGMSRVDLRISQALFDTTPAIVNFRIETNLGDDFDELLFDFEGDGVVDHRGPFSETLSHSYDSPGRYTPRVLARDKDNVLYSSSIGRRSPVIQVVPSVVLASEQLPWEVGRDTVDLEYDRYSGEIFALSAADATIRIFNSAHELQQTVAIPGGLRPQGFALDRDRNLYIADTGNHRVIKLLRATGYQPDWDLSSDGSFSGHGTATGRLTDPHDLVVHDNLTDESRRILVADTGNARIQSFDRHGRFVRAFDGSESGAPALVKPTSIALGGGGIIVVDTGHNTLRVFSVAGRSDAIYGETESVAFSSPLHVSLNGAGLGWVVTDAGNSRVVVLRFDGTIERAIPVSANQPRAALVTQRLASPLLVVAVESRHDLLVAPLLEEPPDQAPDGVVRGLLAALASRDWQQARGYLGVEEQEELDADLQDPDEMARLEQYCTEVRNPTVASRSETSALVLATRETPSGTVTVSFTLTREPGGGRWIISQF